MDEDERRRRIEELARSHRRIETSPAQQQNYQVEYHVTELGSAVTLHIPVSPQQIGTVAVVLPRAFLEEILFQLVKSEQE